MYNAVPRGTLQQAEAHLGAACSHMAQLIAQFGPCQLGLKPRTPFHVLCASIIGQQLSAKAADTIQKRVALLVSAATDQFAPEHFVTVTVEDLRAQGLSNAKARWLLELAARTRDGRFAPEQLAALPDAELAAQLDALPGIGPWTAEMMLIFAFGRLNVFSLGDIGLRRGVEKLFSKPLKTGKPRQMSDRQIQRAIKPWAPYYSVASWYLWRLADGDTSTWT